MTATTSNDSLGNGPRIGLEDVEGKKSSHNRRKVYEDRIDGMRVPFSEVVLSDSPGREGPQPNPPVRLYDTSGPGSVPTEGLSPLRRSWIEQRGDVEEYDGRPAARRDDGRAAVRRTGSSPETFPSSGRRPLRSTGSPVTQLHYARRGEVTPEMEFVALREGSRPNSSATRSPRGERSCQRTSIIPSPSRWSSAGSSSSRSTPTSATRR